MAKKICSSCQNSLFAGGISRREFMRRAAALGAAMSPVAGLPSAAAIAPASDLRPTGPGDFFPYSDMPEAVRERLANALLRKTRVADPDFDDYYAAAAASLSPRDNFLIVTSADRQVNAFAHYGGLIVLMRGMWDIADTEDALLGIIAHEMGHVKLNHFKSKKELNETISAVSVPLLIAGLLAGNAEVRESIIVGGSGIITGQIYGHSRELEHEADVIGLQILSETGRDGRQMAKLLGNLAGAPSEYISTHPAPRRRASYIRDRLLNLPKFAPADGEDFLLLRQKLSVLDKVSPDLIQSKRRELLSASGAQRSALQFGLFLAARISGDDALAAEMEKAAAASEHPIAVAARADYISGNGEHQKAMEMLASARADRPMSAALALRQLIVARRAGKNELILQLQNDLPEEIGNRPDILRETARAAAGLKKDGDANIMLAEAHMKDGAFERAVRQLAIAEKHNLDTKTLSRANRIQNAAKRELAALAKNK